MTLFLPHGHRVFQARSRDSATYCISRPLLDFTRSEVTFLTTLEALPISVDSTNYQYQATRSQIRYGLIPFLHQLGFDDLEEKVNIDELTGTRTRN